MHGQNPLPYIHISPEHAMDKLPDNVLENELFFLPIAGRIHVSTRRTRYRKTGVRRPLGGDLPNRPSSVWTRKAPIEHQSIHLSSSGRTSCLDGAASSIQDV